MKQKMGSIGGGVVKIFQAAEKGEPEAYAFATFLTFYLVVAVGFLTFTWVTGRFLHSRRDLVGVTIAGGISIIFSATVLYGIVTRLPG